MNIFIIDYITNKEILKKIYSCIKNKIFNNLIFHTILLVIISFLTLYFLDYNKQTKEFIISFFRSEYLSELFIFYIGIICFTSSTILLTLFCLYGLWNINLKKMSFILILLFVVEIIFFDFSLNNINISFWFYLSIASFLYFLFFRYIYYTFSKNYIISQISKYGETLDLFNKMIGKFKVNAKSFNKSIDSKELLNDFEIFADFKLTEIKLLFETIKKLNENNFSFYLGFGASVLTTLIFNFFYDVVDIKNITTYEILACILISFPVLLFITSITISTINDMTTATVFQKINLNIYLYIDFMEKKDVKKVGGDTSG